jgi:hypothetical protein
VTDELLARRILALEERVERVEATKAPRLEMVLDRLAELRQDTADRLDGMDRRFDGMDRRLDGMDRRLDGMDRRFDELTTLMVDRFENIDRRFADIDRRFDELVALVGRALPDRTGPGTGQS